MTASTMTDRPSTTTATAPGTTLDALLETAAMLLDVPVVVATTLAHEQPWVWYRSTTDRDLADAAVASLDGARVHEVIGFSVGVPLLASDGSPIGRLAGFDSSPRVAPTVGSDHPTIRSLEALARAVVGHLDLVETNDRLEARAHIFRTSPDLHCVIRADGRIVEVNDRWEAMFGPAPRELSTDAVVARTHRDERTVADRMIHAVVDGEEFMGFRARARRQDGEYRWLEWNVSNVVPGELAQATARDVTALVAQEEALQQSNRILRIIADRYAELLVDGPSRQWWSAVLDDVLAVTNSEYGFIGYTGVDDDGPYLRSMAITDIAWDDATRRLYDESIETGMLFRNTATLFGEVLLNRVMLVANDVAHDPRAGGRPAGHPPLDRFLAMPIGEHDEMLGMIGLANRPAPYDDGVTTQLQPLLAFLRAVIENLRWSEHNEATQREIAAVRSLQERILEVSDAAIVAVDHAGTIELTNERARQMLPRVARPGAVLAECLLTEDDRAWLRTSMTSGGVATSQVSGIDEAGRLVPCEASLTPLDDSGSSRFVLRLIDTSTRHELDRSAAANRMLEARLDQMHQQQRNGRIIVQTVEMLQASSNVDEVLDLLHRSLEQVFAEGSVDLFTTIDDPESFERHPAGGPSAGRETVLLPGTCWAVRTRRPHGSWPGGPAVPCRHGSGDDGVTRFCVPLSYDDRRQILAVIEFPDSTDLQAADRAEQFARLGWMTQSFSSALTNVALRLHLERAALADPLTDLPNRRAFQTEVERRRARAARTGVPQALAMVDLDRFKSVNDTYGHDVGDRVLIQLADVLRSETTGSAVPGRLGGDEFAVFLDDIPADECADRAERLRRLVEERCTTDGGPVTASVGIVHTDDLVAGTGLDDMFRAADDALYEAKRNGRNRITRWTPPR